MEGNIKPEVRYREISETQLSESLFLDILCPNLRVGVRMGLLNPDAEGWVSITELSSFLEYIGVKKGSSIERILVYLGESVTEEKRVGYANITAFRGTFLDHGSSSATLNNPEGFLEERLNLLKSFSSDGERLTQADLAVAANNFNQCPFNFSSKLGTNIQSLELGTLLDIYGRQSSSGPKHFLLEDVDALWRDSRFPPAWKKPERPVAGTFIALLKYLEVTWHRLAKHIFKR